MKKIYDYLIVGAGLYGATCARLLTEKGYKCLVIDKKEHVGGNIATKTINNIDIHLYGPHIFHTDNKEVWDFVNKYTDFNNFVANTLAYNSSENKLYHLPFNMTTFVECFGMHSPEEIQEIINKEITEYTLKTKDDKTLWKEVYNHGILETVPACLESQAISMVGTTIYNALIKGYTEKQWHKSCKELSPEIIKRLPLRWVFNNNYFNDPYQGIPAAGYTQMVNHILGYWEDDDETPAKFRDIQVDIMLNTDYFDNREMFDKMADKIIYTGEIDKFCDYKFGPLEWRSLKFVTKELFDTNNFQGTAIINYTSDKEDYTRVIEHKYFTPELADDEDWQTHTYVTYEYPADWKPGEDAYYPINNQQTQELFNKYEDYITDNYPNVYLGGRLGNYKYYDMDDTIANAAKFCKLIPEKK